MNILSYKFLIRNCVHSVQGLLDFLGRGRGSQKAAHSLRPTSGALNATPSQSSSSKERC